MTQASFALRPETFTLDLSLQGRPAGEMAWQLAPEKHAWVARVQTSFGGVLPDLRRVQTSRLHPRSLTSLGYSEGDGRRASYELTVDRKGGLLTLKQGRDEASLPLLVDLHDPVSVLYWLRAQDDLQRAEIRMAGAGVHVRRLADEEVAGQAARVYELRPGGAVVWVEAHGARRLLQLLQPTDFGEVEATYRKEKVRVRPEPPRRRKR